MIKLAVVVIAACVLLWTIVTIAALSGANHSAEHHMTIPNYSKELKWGCVGAEC